MSTFVPSEQHLREVLICFFHLKKEATEAHQLLAEAYPGNTIDVKMCQRWFKRFKDGDFDTKTKDEVMALQERVGEAQRTVKLELKDLEGSKGSRGKFKNNDLDDSEQFTGARKRMKSSGGGKGKKNCKKTKT